MHLSMGSLWTHIIGVMLEAASVTSKLMWSEVNVRPKPCAVPRLTVCLHWEAKLMGRGAHTRTCKWKVMVDDPRTVLRWFGVIPTDEIKCCGTSVQPLQSVNLFEEPRPRLRTVGKAIQFPMSYLWKWCWKVMGNDLWWIELKSPLEWWEWH